MDITTLGISFGKMSYPCYIHVTSLFKKRYIWIYLGYPRLKQLHSVYTMYIFSCHMPYLSMSYPCHKFVRLSCSGQQMKFTRKLHCCSGEFCIPRHSIHQAQQDLFATATRADSSFAPDLGWGPRQRGSAGAGAAGAGASSSAGSAGGGSTCV